jgi:starch phosphorylase
MLSRQVIFHTMSEQTPVANTRLRPGSGGIEGFESLTELALDLRWSWNHATDQLWRQLDPSLWDLTHNAWVVLQTVSRERLQQVLADPAFRKGVDDMVQRSRSERQAPGWFHKTHAQSPLTGTAYFSMEFMLSEALPIYSGGLGNVAGDQLKAASDLGVPVIGVGLLYSQGYFRQVIDHDGAQQALYPYNDPGQLPIAPLREANGEWLRLEIRLPGYSLWLRAWQVQVGRVMLYLLDSNDIANYPTYRGITSELYGGGSELRLQQELVLGIGGWRLLEALGLRPEVCHLNEGHAAFAVLERARAFMKATGQPFETALTVTRAGNVFTTHTAVTAGFDRFEPSLIKRYLANYANSELHLSPRELLALGRLDPRDAAEPFNMAYLAMRGSGLVNGVSQLHGEVSRRLFQPLYPRWPTGEVPVGHVTNGVHTPSWDSAEADALWTSCCGKNRWRENAESLGQCVCGLSDAAVWECRGAGRKSLIEFARERLSTQLAARGAVEQDVSSARQLFSPDALTLGFARRFATYKRPNLLLQDPERLIRLLSNPLRPVQLILAGKAHPADLAGQALIQEWIRFIRRPGVRSHVMFLSDYDMFLSERLVQGVDVWINTPQRPWEACGTSGMKVLVNGGLNLSELDGWWAEAYNSKVGWALGDGQEYSGDAAWDAVEASQLFDVLEDQVIPEFFSRDESGVPRAWVARVRDSMSSLTPQYSANRSVREYAERIYLPAAAAYRARAEGKGALGLQITQWRRAIDQGWPALRFGRIGVEPREDGYDFTVEVSLGTIGPNEVRVELYADPQAGAGGFRQEMKRLDGEPDPEGRTLYVARVPARRTPDDYTARIVPAYPGVNVPLEDAHVLWQR